MDQAKFNAFLGQVVGDMGATMHAALIILGDKLGLYKAMARQAAALMSKLPKDYSSKLPGVTVQPKA